MKPIQLELPFTDDIEQVNADLNMYYEKQTIADLDNVIQEYEESVRLWKVYYDN